MSKPVVYIDLHKMRSGQYFPNDYVSDHPLPGYTKFVEAAPDNPDPNRVTVDGGALKLVLNVLRNNGKHEVAATLEETAIRGEP